MKKIICEIIAFLLTLTLFLGTTMYLGYFYMPTREQFGATWNMYGEEQENSIDVMFVGSSVAYCDIIPAKIYEETGLTSYIVGAPNMIPGIAYHYLKEALKTQDPELVMLEATSFCFVGISEDDSKVNVGYMPYSLNRLEATFKVAHPSERLGLLFPLYNYHSKWSEYSIGQLFSPRPDCKEDIYAGYTYLDTASPQEEFGPRDYQISDEDFGENMDYLRKIVDLCKDRNIKLELFMVPSCQYVSEELTERISAEAPDIPLTRFNDNFDELGLSLETDYYDFLHLNYSGAKKYTKTLADHIQNNYSIQGHDHDRELWNKRVEFVYTDMEKDGEEK